MSTQPKEFIKSHVSSSSLPSPSLGGMATMAFLENGAYTCLAPDQFSSYVSRLTQLHCLPGVYVLLQNIGKKIRSRWCGGQGQGQYSSQESLRLSRVMIPGRDLKFTESYKPILNSHCHLELGNTNVKTFSLFYVR